ncbi:serine/threonine protein kinase [Rhodococcus opacus]|uniref:Serine/threonine protein kinase n=1 Tax=Rhodococcus opacus TaxID=37919 RepID=A0A2S8IW65_RHOOP|nr:serine/threonine protein kinase [Rhodococcus opacus]PQP18988.1 serine/threonine protein kinase [Rhodococcus opacus]
MRTRRWSENPAPACGGIEVHGHHRLATAHHLTLDLTRVVAYDAGLAVHLALTATADPARRARHQTRPLTDPRDLSARWSYLDVWLGILDHLVVADPYRARPDVHASAAGRSTYRTEPQYWIPTDSDVLARAITLTVEWAEIGLAPALATIALDRPVNPRRTPSRF